MIDALAALGVAFKSLDKITDILKTVKDADSKLIIADLKGALADLKIELSTMNEEKHSLVEKIRTLESLPDIRNKFHSVGGAYYLLEEFDGYKKDFYCSACFESKNKLFPLSQPMPGTRIYNCNVCHAKYTQLHTNFLQTKQ